MKIPVTDQQLHRVSDALINDIKNSRGKVSISSTAAELQRQATCLVSLQKCL